MTSQSPQNKLQAKPKGYHHGDLRSTLLEKAEEMLAEQGINGLTLRGLAERAGVSRQAPYHHFASKQALLFALAEQAFADLDKVFELSIEAQALPVPDRFRAFVVGYVRYATSNPEKYELMFGPITWRSDPSPALVQKGQGSFRSYAAIVKGMQEGGDIPAGVDTLRLAQATWATLHGLCRLKNDGIFESSDSIEEISLYAVNMMMAVLGQVPK